MENKKPFMYYVGWGLGAIVFTCLAACLAAVCIALTVKFIGWIF